LLSAQQQQQQQQQQPQQQPQPAPAPTAVAQYAAVAGYVQHFACCCFVVARFGFFFSFRVFCYLFERAKKSLLVVSVGHPSIGNCDVGGNWPRYGHMNIFYHFVSFSSVLCTEFFSSFQLSGTK
jgi:hypothetical protein